MTLKELASELAKREGQKSQVKIGDVREILGHLSDLIAEDGAIVIDEVAGERNVLSPIATLLWKNGLRRKARKKGCAK